MLNCNKVRMNLVAYLCGELQQKEQEYLDAHIERCQGCQQELAGFKQVLKGADSLEADIQKEMASVDWDMFPENITNAVFERSRPQIPPQRKSSLWALIWQPRFKPVYAALFIGILIGGIFSFTIFRPQQRAAARNVLMVPERILNQMDIEMARRETLDYLDKSQYLLLDFIQSTPEKATGFWQSEFVAGKARDLLSQKKYINQQLDKYQMAKAKAICDQIELLFLELTQLSSELSEVQLERISSLIQDRQLLLRIKLVKKELKQSEV